MEKAAIEFLKSDFKQKTNNNNVVGKLEARGSQFFYIKKKSPIDFSNSYWYNKCKISIPPSFFLLGYTYNSDGLVLDFQNAELIGNISGNNSDLDFIVNLGLEPLSGGCFDDGDIGPTIKSNPILYDYKKLKNGTPTIAACGSTCREYTHYANNTQDIIFALPIKNFDKPLIENEQDVAAYFLPCLGKIGNGRAVGDIVYNFAKDFEELEHWLSKAEKKGGIASEENNQLPIPDLKIDGIEIIAYTYDYGNGALKPSPGCGPRCVYGTN
ncbi:MAG: hypothetical protein AAF806_09380 [Bacteroidota bacterium]